MEIISQNAVLDSVSFQVSSSNNSYEALICRNGIIEKLDIGPLDQLAAHLPKARELCDFDLRPDASFEASSWFTKSTISRFLHVVNTPDELKHADETESEIRQLDENRRFHIALYSKDNSNLFGGEGSDVSHLNNADLSHQIKLENVTSDATKSELIRAMDLRLTALKEELLDSFNRAIGDICYKNRVSDLALFAQHFGAVDLSNSLFKFLELCSTKLQNYLNESVNNNQTTIRRPSLFSGKSNAIEASTPGVSLAKVALAERQISSESESSSESSDTDSHVGERSRSAASSASLIHRIQIGRSGPRWPTTVTIKNLNRFSTSEKAILNSNSNPTETGDNEIEHPLKKPESKAARMSVQDAISLFERRRKDETVDLQKLKTSEVSINGDDPTLRRCSSGSPASFFYSPQENQLDCCHNILSSSLNHEAEEEREVEVKLEPSTSENIPDEHETFYMAEPQQVESRSEPTDTSNLMEFFYTSIDKKGEFHQHKHNRDEIFQLESTSNRATEQAQIKPLRETPEESKSAMASRSSRPVARPESFNGHQKPMRNSSLAGKSKKDVSKMSVTKISMSKSSSPRTPRPLPVEISTIKRGTKPANCPSAVSRVSIPTRRRSQPPSSPVQPSPGPEKIFQISKGNKPYNSAKTKAEKSGKDSYILSSKPSIPSKLTKKSTVVPMESKPFLRKGFKTVKPKDPVVPKHAEFSKNDKYLVPHEENESNAPPSFPTVAMTEISLICPAAVEEDESSTFPLDNDAHIKTAALGEASLAESNVEIENSDAPLIAEIQCDIITEHEDEFHGVSSVVPSGSRPRHSLSQMLQAESSELEVVEWGNIENPPSFVFQKDAPKGLKKLLKFTRKSRGEGNSMGGSSPSISSECEEGGGGSSSKKAIDYRIVEDISSGSDNLSAGGTTKGMRSFFSLSSFRSIKSNAKP